MASLSLSDDATPQQTYETYWHLDVTPWDHMISLMELFSKYFAKSYDEVAEMIAADPPRIQALLDDWRLRFTTQKALVDDILCEWGQKILYPKWSKEMPAAKKMADRRGDTDEHWKYEASQFVYLMPHNEYGYCIGYYGGTLAEATGSDDSALVAAVKHDYGVTVKYPYLPVFGATLPSGDVHTWPLEMMHVSIAVPLMLNL